MKPVMKKAGYMLLYHGKRKHDPDEVRPDIRQAYCSYCSKLWNISVKNTDCPYFCPRCEMKRNARKKTAAQQ